MFLHFLGLNVIKCVMKSGWGEGGFSMHFLGINVIKSAMKSCWGEGELLELN